MMNGNLSVLKTDSVQIYKERQVYIDGSEIRMCEGSHPTIYGGGVFVSPLRLSTPVTLFNDSFLCKSD